jgi:hypothetical protein
MPFNFGFNPLVDEEEQNEFASRPLPVGVNPEQLPVENAAAEPAPFNIQNPLVKDHMQKYTDAARQKLVDQNAEDASGPNWLAGLAALGSGLQGGNAAEAGMKFLKGQQDDRNSKLAQFDENKKFAMASRDDASAQQKMAREKDPMSDESKLAQEQAVQLGVSPATASKITAEQWKARGPTYLKMYEVAQKKIENEQNRNFKNEELGLKRQELAAKLAEKNGEKSLDKKLTSLNATDKQRLDNATMVMRSLKEMDAALAGGSNTFSAIGDNPYTIASRNAAEGYGRMQSGGAINKDEEKRFIAASPRATDSKEVQALKLKTQQQEMIKRLKTLGFSPEELGLDTSLAYMQPQKAAGGQDTNHVAAAQWLADPKNKKDPSYAAVKAKFEKSVNQQARNGL